MFPYVLFYLFARLYLLSTSSGFFSSLIFFLLPFSSLTLPTSAASSVHMVGSLTSKHPSVMVTFPFFPDGKLIACWPPGLRLRPSNGWVVLRIKERIWRWLRVHGSTCVIRLLNKHFRPTCRETPVIWIIKPYDRNDMDIFFEMLMPSLQ